MGIFGSRRGRHHLETDPAKTAAVRAHREVESFVEEHRGALIAEYRGVKLYPDRLIRLARPRAGDSYDTWMQPLAGVTAAVDSRLYVMGKQAGGGSLHDHDIHITGPGFAWTVKAGTTFGTRPPGMVRKFVDAVNQAARARTAPATASMW